MTEYGPLSAEIIDLYTASPELLALSQSPSHHNDIAWIFPSSDRDDPSAISLLHSPDVPQYRFIVTPEDTTKSLRIFEVLVLGTVADLKVQTILRERFGEDSDVIADFIRFKKELGFTKPNPDELEEFQRIQVDFQRYLDES